MLMRLVRSAGRLDDGLCPILGSICAAVALLGAAALAGSSLI